jgi:hypothetical protein
MRFDSGHTLIALSCAYHRYGSATLDPAVRTLTPPDGIDLSAVYMLRIKKPGVPVGAQYAA